MKIANPAHVAALAAYPVGSIYMSVNATNPGTLFGGTWQQMQGRFLLGASSAYPAGSTGGETTHTLTEEEMPIHSHLYYEQGSGATLVNNGTTKNVTNWGEQNRTSQNAGGSKPHNNMPPYLAVYMWKRTA